MKRIFVGLIALGLAIGLMLGCQLKEPAATVDQTQVSAAADELILASADIFGSDISTTVYYEDSGDGAGDGTTGGNNDTFDNPSAGNNDDDTLLDPDTDDLSRADFKFVMAFSADGDWSWESWQFERGDSTTGDNFDSATTGEGWVQTDGMYGTFEYDEEERTLTLTWSGNNWGTVTADKFDSFSSTNQPADGDIIKMVFDYVITDSVTIDTSEVPLTVPTYEAYTWLLDIIDGYDYYPDGTNTQVEWEYSTTGTWTSQKYTKDRNQTTYVFDEENQSFELYTHDLAVDTTGTVTGGVSGAYQVYEYPVALNATIDSGAMLTLEDARLVSQYADAGEWAYDSSTKDYKLSSSAELDWADAAPMDVAVQAVLDADGEVEGYIIP